MPQISIIIPTINEATTLPGTLTTLTGRPDLEIIVADGGSRDDTLAIARDAGCTVVAGGPGRARQMNTGAAVAHGQVFLFLHADTRLPAGFAPAVRQCLARPGVVAGAFKLAIDQAGWTIRLVEKLANLRAGLRQLPYGDQAIFLNRRQFYRCGGFPEVDILEDLLLIQQLRGMGTVAILDLAATTSGRRWQQGGVLRNSLKNQGILLAFRSGVSPARLARLYYGRSRGGQ